MGVHGHVDPLVDTAHGCINPPAKRCRGEGEEEAGKKDVKPDSRFAEYRAGDRDTHRRGTIPCPLGLPPRWIPVGPFCDSAEWIWMGTGFVRAFVGLCWFVEVGGHVEPCLST